MSDKLVRICNRVITDSEPDSKYNDPLKTGEFIINTDRNTIKAGRVESDGYVFGYSGLFNLGSIKVLYNKGKIISPKSTFYKQFNYNYDESPTDQVSHNICYVESGEYSFDENYLYFRFDEKVTYERPSLLKNRASWI